MNAIVVPGHGRNNEGTHRISKRCLRLVAAAEQLAELVDPVVIVFTGWSEAEQMRDAWRGREVELVVEPTAKHTGENATRTLPLLRDRGVTRAVVVCTATHAARVRLLFGRIYASRGIDVGYRIVRGRRNWRAIVWEGLSMPFVPWQLVMAQRELGR